MQYFFVKHIGGTYSSSKDFELDFELHLELKITD